MRFIHTADWHVGKKLHGFDLLEDQLYIFQQLKNISLDKKVDAIVVAGDIYDRSLPNEQCVQTVNQLLEELNLQAKLPLFVINGNHDSAVRLDTGSQWFDATDFYLRTSFAQAFEPVVFADVQFFMLPYFEPQEARNYFEDQEIATTAQAVKRAVKEMQKLFLPDKKHVLIAHFFAAGSTKSASETLLEVGGLSPVGTDCLEIFDYVALGHLHDKNALKHPNIKYSGTPLKYSLAEANSQKGVWLVDTKEQTSEFIALEPKHDVKVLKGAFADLTEPSFVATINRDDYIGIELTDTQIIVNAMERLRSCYPKTLSLKRVNWSDDLLGFTPKEELKHLEPIELLQGFFEEVNQNAISQKQLQWAKQALIDVQKEV